MTLATIRSIALATIRSGYLHRISTPLARLRETGSLSCRAMPPAPAAAAPARTIVVVEDEASIASAVAARLRSEGFVVEIADDGPRRGDETVHLTPTEFDLLAHLASHPGQVFTRGQLLVQVWGYHDGSGARTVDSHVLAVRRKLGPDVIRTVHGVGYAADDNALTAASGGTRERS